MTDVVSSDVYALLSTLLPGFLCAWIFNSLSSFFTRSNIERLIQAFIFTVLIQAVRAVVFKFITLPELASTPKESELVYTVLISVVLGLVFSYFSNNDSLHCFLRRLGLTQQPSYGSEWFGAFMPNRGYVTLHLSGERRLYGWPKLWPTLPNSGHFLLTDPVWINDNGDFIESPGVASMLVDAKDVEMVEFMKVLYKDDIS